MFPSSPFNTIPCQLSANAYSKYCSYPPNHNVSPQPAVLEDVMLGQQQTYKACTKELYYTTVSVILTLLLIVFHM